MVCLALVLFGKLCLFCFQKTFSCVFGLLCPQPLCFVFAVQFVFIFLGNQAGNLTSWLALFNFNIFLSGGGTCIAPLTDFELLVTGLWVPLLGFGFLMLNMLLHYLVWLCAHKRPRCVANAVWEWGCMQDLHNAEAFGRIVLTYRRTALGFIASSCMMALLWALRCALSPFEQC